MKLAEHFFSFSSLFSLWFYFVVYAPIISITLVLVCSGFEIRFTCDEPSNGRKNEVEGHVDERNL